MHEGNEQSRANLEALRAVYDEWSRGNFRAGTELLDERIVFRLGPEFIDAGTSYGIEAMRDYMRGFLPVWTELTIAADEFVEAGDSVAVGVVQRGSGVESETPVEMRYHQVWSFRGAAVIRLENFRNRADALEAIGRPAHP